MFQTAPKLSLLSSGRTSGVVVDLGHDLMRSVVIDEGRTCRGSAMRVEMGGREMTNHLMQLANTVGYSFTTSAERQIVRDIKEKLGYIRNVHTKVVPKEYELPDGNVITLRDQLHEAPEALFNPSVLLKNKTPGVHHLVHESLLFMKHKRRDEFSKHIVLSGGSSMFKGISERLQHELKNLGHRNSMVIAPDDRKYSIYHGGSILMKLSTSERMITSKQEYEEFGHHEVFRRSCLV